MRIRLIRGARPWMPPRSAVVAAIVLLALGLAVAAMSRSTEGPVTCPFRAVTGLPCPTCGMVRVTNHVLHGEFIAAFRTNPLDATFLLLVAPFALAAIVVNRTRGWRLEFRLSPVERRLAWAALAAVAAANWIYVLGSSV